MPVFIISLLDLSDLQQLFVFSLVQPNLGSFVQHIYNIYIYILVIL